MIRKLRRKFVLVNMVFVCTILLITLGLLLGSYVRRTSQSVRFYMESELRRVQGQYSRNTRRISEREKPDGNTEEKKESGTPIQLIPDFFLNNITGQRTPGVFMPSIS